MDRRVIAKLLVPILKNYIDNLNGYFLREPTAIYAAWGETYKVSPKQFFKGIDTEVVADTIIVSRFTKKNSIRINSTGISIIVELANIKQANNASPIAKTEAKTETELKKIFELYNAKFDSTWLSVFEPIDPKASITANISKAEISTILNEALSKPIILRQNFNIPATTFNQKLEVERGYINCQQVRTNFKYPAFNGDRCDWSCMRNVLGGRVEDPVCAASRRACRVRVEGQRIAWQAARETARIAHQTENEAKVAACNVWRETLDFLALGRFKGAVSGNGKAFIYLNSFSFAEDLSQLTLGFSGGLDGNLESDLTLNPVDLGHIFFCYSNYDKKINSKIVLNIPEANRKISIRSNREEENLNLNIKLDKVSYDAKINPSPLHSLLLDPQFAVKCPIRSLLQLTTLGAAAGRFLGMVKLAPEQELLLLGSVKGEYGIEEMKIPFRPIKFKVNNGQYVKSTIFWNSKSILFRL